MQMDASVASGRLQQARELPLGRLQRRIRHVVDQADCQDLAIFRLPFEFIGLAQLRGHQRGADDTPRFVE